MADEAPRPLSTLAVVAFVLGLFPPTGLCSLPLGFWARVRIKRRRLAGLPVAWGAMGLGLIWLLGAGEAVYLRVSSGADVYERAGIETLQSIHAGQLRHSAATGEFGDFPQIAGKYGVSNVLRTLEAPHGVARRPAYLYRIWLLPDRERRRTEYLCYAWPEEHGHPAVRAFLLDGRTGRIWACSNGTHITGRYSGLERVPAVGSAFPSTAMERGWPRTGVPPGGRTADGEDWAVLE